jgi:cyclophilin family peptidyl-prolyl cis-trans isomerase
MTVLKLTLAGRIDDEDYQKTYECINFLRTDRPSEFEFTILEMFPVEWEAHLVALRERTPLRTGVNCIVHTDDMKTVWTGGEFVSHICEITQFKIFHYDSDSLDVNAYHNQAKIRYKQFLKRTGHSFCFLQINIDGEPTSERVVFELYTDVCPHTCNNFLHLCVGDLGDIDSIIGTQKIPHHDKLHYKGTCFFRIVRDGWIQAGDIVNNTGNGGHSIYGSVFPDECFSVKHNDEGILGMANNGKDTNASQFYITVKRNSWMDGIYVAFGRVIEGISVIRRIHNLPTHPDQRPKINVLITDCGEIRLNQF